FETLSLGRLLRSHSQSCSFRLRLLPMGGLRRAIPAGGRSPRGLSCPAAGAGGGFGLPAHAGRTLFQTLTSFSCHCSRVGLTPLLTVSSKSPGKICSENGGSGRTGALFIM